MGLKRMVNSVKAEKKKNKNRTDRVNFKEVPVFREGHEGARD